MLILNIDTALDTGSFCISSHTEVLSFGLNQTRNDQAGWLHHAIQQGLERKHLSLKDIEAVAVSNGPGSYTGLRVGLATAKGLSYALNIPLICVSTLQIMAHAVKEQAADLICPMIDARRMEVFTALYDNKNNTYQNPFATILNNNSFTDLLNNRQILFTGNGIDKFKTLIIHNHNAAFITRNFDARDMIEITSQMFLEKKFADAAYSGPFYVKDAHINNASHQ